LVKLQNVKSSPIQTLFIRLNGKWEPIKK